MPRTTISRFIFAIALITVAGAANASETITYSYDAKDRLIGVIHAGSVNDTLSTTYALDAADNRTSVVTTGASPRVVIVPLSGFTIIPLP